MVASGTPGQEPEEVIVVAHGGNYTKSDVSGQLGHWHSRGTFRGSLRGSFGRGGNEETTVERAGEAGESAEKTAEGNESRCKSKESVAESNETGNKSRERILEGLGTDTAAVCAAVWTENVV